MCTTRKKNHIHTCSPEYGPYIICCRLFWPHQSVESIKVSLSRDEGPRPSIDLQTSMPWTPLDCSREYWWVFSGRWGCEDDDFGYIVFVYISICSVGWSRLAGVPGLGGDEISWPMQKIFLHKFINIFWQPWGWWFIGMWTWIWLWIGVGAVG